MYVSPQQKHSYILPPSLSRRSLPSVGLFLLTTLAFILFAMLNKSGWTLGHIITTSVLMPQTARCPPGMTELGPNAKCEALEIVISNSRINYGKDMETDGCVVVHF